VQILTDYLSSYKRRFEEGEYRDCGLVYVGYHWQKKRRYNIYHYDCKKVDDVWRKVWSGIGIVKYILMEMDSARLRGLNCVVVCDEKNEELCMRRVYKDLGERILGKGSVDDEVVELLEMVSEKDLMYSRWDTIVIGKEEKTLVFLRFGYEDAGVLLLADGGCRYWAFDLGKWLVRAEVCEHVWGDIDKVWARILLGGE